MSSENGKSVKQDPMHSNVRPQASFAIEGGGAGILVNWAPRSKWTMTMCPHSDMIRGGMMERAQEATLAQNLVLAEVLWILASTGATMVWIFACA